MNRPTADELQRVLERSGLKDPSLTDEDREELFTLALRHVSDDALDYLVERLTDQQTARGRGPAFTFGDEPR